MSAPPLPEAFGNYALGDFAEVVAPAAISWLPQTSGWLWLGGFLILWLGRQLWMRLRRWYRNRYRREALAHLQRLQQSHSTGLPVSELNHLLKLTALAAWPRKRVARLSGSRWVAFLNETCQSAPFDGHCEQLLAGGGYRLEVVAGASSDQLLRASRQWISEHRGPADV